MTTALSKLRKILRTKANPAKAKVLSGFFKTGKGQYGEGDCFLGITVPQSRAIAQDFHQLSLEEIEVLLKSAIHEERLIALIVLVEQYKKSDPKKRESIYVFYLKNARRVNNWDLVDSSAHHIVGAHLHGKPKTILKKLAASENLWERRIAMVACWYDIKKRNQEPAITIAAMLLKDQHDLIHKAVGWMLREVGKHVSQAVLEDFLCRYLNEMPRTTLRYAIERLPEHRRKVYMKS